MSAPEPLDNITIVLVRTKTPGNIGAVCRCMMNMGLSRLALVRPPRDPDGEARKLAAGAEEILLKAKTFATLAEAVEDQARVIGTSRRPGRLRKNIVGPRELAEAVLPLLPRNNVALVFGSEVNGLELDELALCHEIAAIPSSETFPSLNLSHAVMIVAYELFVATQTAAPSAAPALASAGELEQFFRHFERVLVEIGFADAKQADRLMHSFRGMFNRARLEPRDVALLQGVLTRINGYRGRN